MSNINMSQTELIFRGLDAEECSSFIREVHKRAHEAGRLRDSAWMADIAMIAFDGSALDWFDEQTPETQADWMLLRRSLIQKYRNNRFDPVPPAAITTPTRMAIATNTPTSVSVAVPTINTPPVTLRPPARLYPYRRSDTPVFNIKVVAPKVSYIGYVSHVFGDSEFGGRCCTLTGDKAVAFECLEPTRSELRQANSTGNANVPLSTLNLFRTRDNWLSSVLSLATQIVGSRGSDGVTIREDGQPLEDHRNSLGESWNWDRPTGRFTHIWGPYIMLGKNCQGELTLFFWDRRVWDDDDDAYAAELYLIRAN